MSLSLRSKSSSKSTSNQGIGDTARRALSYIRANFGTLIVLLAALIFLYLLQDVTDGDINRLDNLAFRLLVVKLRHPVLTTVMESFTALSSVVVLLVLTMVIAALAPGRSPGLCVSINLIAVVLLNTIFKYLVQRPRPDGFRLITESGYSFPSGHSMVAMAFFGLLIWMIWRYHKHDIMRVVWSVGFGFIAIMVGVSRVYLGVHYASDVLAGFCVSLIWLIFYCRLITPLFMPEPNQALSTEIASEMDEAIPLH